MRHLFAALTLIASASLFSQDDCDLFNIQELVEEYDALVEENQQLHDSISDYIEIYPYNTEDDEFSLNLSNSGSVLIYATTGGGTSLEDAADNLGVSYTYTSSESELISAFDQGDFELLVIEHGVGSLSQDVIQRIIGWVNRGNKLILSYGELSNHSDLLAAVGVSVASTTSVARDIHPPAARPVNLFGLPIVRGGYNTWNEFLYLDASTSDFGLAVSGVDLGFGTKLSGESELGLILGRYDSSQSGAPAIMMTKHGRVIVHGFSTRPYAGSDIDGDANNDLRELFENEILYFLTRSELGSREDMIRISAGTFTMGAAITDPYQDADEYTRDVTISRDFQLGRTEVTNRLFEDVMGSISSVHLSECGFGCPVTNVGWEQAVLFANEMSVREGRDQCYQQTNPTLVEVDLGCNGYRLPTEAEWEYSAKAGTNNMLSSGNFISNSCGTTETNVTSVAWFCGNSGDRTHPVAQLEPNANGLYDMHGNAWEWVTDVYGNYSFNDETDPIGVTSNPTGQRVIRGGAYNSSPSSIRSTYRQSVSLYSSGYNQVGFRLARTDVSEDWFKVDVLANAQPVPSTGAAVSFSSLDNSIFGLTIPFTFNFMGSDETLLYVATNGIISFEPSNLGTQTNRPIPLGGPPSALIAGWWDDLDLTTSGAIRQETTGVAPNRVFAIHFDDVPRAGSSGSDNVSMSFYLFETSNVIEVHYEMITGSGWSASAGWESDIAETSGADVFGCVLGCDENDFPTGQILRYTPIQVR